MFVEMVYIWDKFSLRLVFNTICMCFMLYTHQVSQLHKYLPLVKLIAKCVYSIVVCLLFTSKQYKRCNVQMALLSQSLESLP